MSEGSEPFMSRQLPNGVTLVGQTMPQVSSAAMTMVVPAGAAHDPEGLDGAAAILSEWLLRGAGDRDTRQLNDAFDALGVQHHESVRSDHMIFSAGLLGRNLADVLELYADVILRPRLSDDAFEPCRALVQQDLESLEDEPAHKCTLRLRERFYPRPLGSSTYGRAETLAAVTPKALRRHAAARLSPAGTILAVAGEFDWNALCDQIERLFGQWHTPQPPRPTTSPPQGGIEHVAKPSAQTHIGLAWPTVTLGSDDYYAARLAGMVLSGGPSARLHTEVREKRGLVYHVSASYHSLKDHAGVFAYAGTRPELAQQTFETTLGEIRGLSRGVEPEEIQRARTQLKSALIMQGESTSARANALASDYYHLGRLRTLAELSRGIDETSIEQVNEFLRAHPARDFTVLVIGPEPVDTSILEAAS